MALNLVVPVADIATRFRFFFFSVFCFCLFSSFMNVLWWKMFTVIDYRLQARGTYIFCWPAGIYVLQDIHSVELGVCPMQLFIFDYVTFIQFKICCCVQNFMKIRWIFAEIWRYKDFQNGGRPPSWNCFTIIQDHPLSLCCWLQLPVKFHVNLIRRSEVIAI